MQHGSLSLKLVKAIHVGHVSQQMKPGVFGDNYALPIAIIFEDDSRIDIGLHATEARKLFVSMPNMDASGQ